MKQSHMVALLQECQTVACEYPGSSRSYTFKVSPDMADKINDLLNGDLSDAYGVVDTGGMSIVNITEVHDEPQIDVDAPYEYKWLVCVFDTIEYDGLKELDKNGVKTLRDAKKTKQKAELIEALGVDAKLIPSVKRLS